MEDVETTREPSTPGRLRYSNKKRSEPESVLVKAPIN